MQDYACLVAKYFPKPAECVGKPFGDFRDESRQHSRPARIIQLTLALTPGTRLGVYEVTAQIGAGGMGEVYKGRDTRLDRTVAIKVLPEALAADPQFRERFDREARTISRLAHPNICTLFDVGEEAGTAFLVMELLEGETLESRCVRASAKGSGLPLDEALRIAMQMADALAAAHRQGIVHRDLKPGNIFLVRSGGLQPRRSPSCSTSASPERRRP